MHEDRHCGVGPLAQYSQDDAQQKNGQSDGREAVLNVDDGKEQGSKKDAEYRLQGSPEEHLFADDATVGHVDHRDLRDALRTQRVVDAILKAASDGRVVDIE